MKINFQVPPFRKNFITASVIFKLLIAASFSLLPLSTFAQGRSEPSFHAAKNFNTGLTEPRSMAIADFNHDGIPDVVLGGFGPLFSNSRYAACLAAPVAPSVNQS